MDLRHEKDLIKPQGPSYGAVATVPKIQASTFDRNAPRTPPVEVGIDLTEFYMSVEWDILEVRHPILSIIVLTDSSISRKVPSLSSLVKGT